MNLLVRRAEAHVSFSTIIEQYNIPAKASNNMFQNLPILLLKKKIRGKIRENISQECTKKRSSIQARRNRETRDEMARNSTEIGWPSNNKTFHNISIGSILAWENKKKIKTILERHYHFSIECSLNVHH